MYFGESDASERALEIVPAQDEQVKPGESQRERARKKKTELQKEAQREFA